MTKRVCSSFLLGATAIFCAAGLANVQQPQISPEVYDEIKFRFIGPVGNRATAVVGIAGIRKAAEELTDKLAATEGKVLQLKATGRGQDDVRWAPMLLQKISYLAGEAASFDFPPTTQQVAVQEELKQQGEKYLQEYQQLVAKDVAAFNSMLRERNIPNIIVNTP